LDQDDVSERINASGVIGVYAIRLRGTEQCYIGSSANVGQRWNHHRSFARRGAHPNHLFQSAWDEYGEASFEFEVVEVAAEVSALNEREQAWLDRLRPYDPGRGFNRSPSTHGAGWKYTEEQRARLSAALTGKKKSPEHVAKMRLRVATDADRARMADVGRAGAGVPKSAEHRRAIGQAQVGELNHKAKLTDASVAQIKHRLADGERGRALAGEFGVHESIISEIKTGRRWTHVAAAVVCEPIPLF
jgi:group I intron endonuclease